MRILEDKIIEEGQVLGTDIIKIDSFLNHQIDMELVLEIGKEFAARFKDTKANKILTIEASGIAIACATAVYMGNLPILFAKKAAPNTMVDGNYATEVTSFTKRKVYTVMVSKKYLGEEDNVLIIDDFMAHGEAASGLVDICRQAGARIEGIGIAVEKEFQGGSRKLKDQGQRVESLAVITSMEDGHINFKK